MKTFVFTFDLETERVTCKIPILKDLNLDLDDIMVDKCAEYDLESKYGVHDINFDDDNIWGWNSYEVEEEKIPELMNKWRVILIELGYDCGDVVTSREAKV